MTRRMSVSATQDQVRARIKTQTRRTVETWQDLKVGDRLTLIEKGMGLPKGAKQVAICDVEITAVRVERLDAITDADVEAEGFGDAGAAWFVRFYATLHSGVTGGTMVRVISWRYL